MIQQKLIQLQVQLAPGTGTNQPNSFVQSGVNVGDTVTLSGLRMSVRIQNSGSPLDQRATVKVWGLTPSLMAQLATLGLVFNLVPKNTLTIQAGQTLNGAPQLATIFSGTIWAAYADYEAQPDVPFIFECQAGAAAATLNVPPSSFPGSASVATMMAGFARQMNLGFENNGVTATLTNAYFSGSAKTQAQKCADSAPITWGIFVNVLAIWPRGGNRATPNVQIISPATGMITYPAFTQQGIIVKTLFNPQIAFGQLVEVQSSVLSAIAAAQPNQPALPNGTTVPTFPSQWALTKLDLALDTLLPKGQWMSTIYAYNPGYSRTILPPTT